MYLKYLQIRNFRNIRKARFEFKKGSNTIIGENDSGKSNAIDALRILLDSNFYYSSKNLKKDDFSNYLENWKGHWIIISAFFDEITANDKTSEITKAFTLNHENEQFLRSFIRTRDTDAGTVTLFIRPNKIIAKALSNASSNIEEFDSIRNGISTDDYEFYYTARSEENFADDDTYLTLVGDIDHHKYVSYEATNKLIVGSDINIMNVWEHISISFIDALRDVSSEIRKPKNPLKRIFDHIQKDIASSSKEEIKAKIRDLNNTISTIKEINDIGSELSSKLQEIVGLVYSPNINIESHINDSIESLSRYLTITPSGQDSIESLGLGHLNILYIAMKLLEFQYLREHQIINIMIIEEPEAHIHPHIQKTLFDNLKGSQDYTQVIMTTHSTHLSEVSSIQRVNILKPTSQGSKVMIPSNKLNEFGETQLDIHEGLKLIDCLERYLDAKRSVLLFSKGVVLVEGDGEEIMIPAMVKKAFGVSLDELGIGLINVGSVAFEYIASLFAEERLQRRCAIITDFDAPVEGSHKIKPNAEKLGITRKDKLDNLFKNNKWVSTFYAPHTFEIDFADIQHNRSYVKSLISCYYKSKNKISEHETAIEGNDAERYDSIMKIVGTIKKGWYATILASIIDDNVIIPSYILEALAFASHDVISLKVLKKIANHILLANSICPIKLNETSSIEELSTYLETQPKTDSIDQLKKYISELVRQI